MRVNLDEIVSHLEKIKNEHGDESYHVALKGLFSDLLDKDGGIQYIESLLEKLGVKDFDLEALKAVGPKVAPPRETQSNPEASAKVIEQTIQQGMPNCKTKAHFDLVLRASEALRIYLDAAFGFDRATATQAREGLNRLLDLAPGIASVTEKLEEHPEATSNRDYVDPPRTHSDEEIDQKSLIEALEMLGTTDELSTWYARMKPAMDRIHAARLRNELFDAIRGKKAALRDKESN